MVKLKVSAALQRIKKILTGSKGKTFVKNTKEAEVKFASNGGAIERQKAKRPSPKNKKGKKGIIARGCGAVLSNRRKRTTGSVSA